MSVGETNTWRSQRRHPSCCWMIRKIQATHTLEAWWGWESTLAQEIVDFLQANGHLATFTFLFCGSSSDLATVIQTMARQCTHPRAILPVEVVAHVQSQPSLREYMESYVIKPICSLSYSLVVVVDGLDDWDSRSRTLPFDGTCDIGGKSYLVAGFNSESTEQYFAKMDWEMRKPSPFTMFDLSPACGRSTHFGHQGKRFHLRANSIIVIVMR